MFEHLDDPHPLAPSGPRLAAVRARVRRRRQRRAAVAGGVASIAVLGVGALTAARDRLEPERIEVGGLPSAEERPARGEPVTILVVGVDGTAGAPTADAAPGRGLHTDTLALVRIDPEAGELRLLTVPRDLMADGLPGPGRINSALERGGPDLLVRSITGLLGVEVDHYVQVDFAGAVALADAVGGIRVAVDRPIRDEATGIELAAGCQTLDGEATLGLDRSRRIEIRGPDGVWTQDPSSAVGRDVRAAAVAAALLQAAARIDVHDLPTLVRTGLDWLTVDALLDTEDLVDWARRSRDDRYVPLSLPVADATVAGAQVLQLDDGAAHVVAAFLAGGDPRPPAPPRRAPAIENTGLRPC